MRNLSKFFKENPLFLIMTQHFHRYLNCSLCSWESACSLNSSTFRAHSKIHTLHYITCRKPLVRGSCQNEPKTNDTSACICVCERDVVSMPQTCISQSPTPRLPQLFTHTHTHTHTITLHKPPSPLESP